MYHLLLLAKAVIMLFQLRSLMQSSSADPYHQWSLAVRRLTDPCLRFLPAGSFSYRGIYCGGFLFALLFAMIFWLCLCLFTGLDFRSAVLLTACMYLKCFGYLLILLLLIQALASWLENTRPLSFYLSQITHVITAPVQRVIPPIGMVDISLMVVLLLLYALSHLLGRLFGYYWYIM